MAFDINRIDLYDGHEDERTRKRLQEIIDCGMDEVAFAEFGVEGVMSGLYIERVWSYTDEFFNDYLDWVKELIAKRKED